MSVRVASVIARSDVIGGASVYVRDLCLALQRDGVTSRLFVGGEGPFLDDLTSHGVEHTAIRAMGRDIVISRDVSSYQLLRSELVRWQPNVIAAHGAKAGALARILGARHRVPVVYTPHGWSFEKGDGHLKTIAYHRLEQLLDRLPATVVHVSAGERALAARCRVGGAGAGLVISNSVPDVRPELRADPSATPVRTVMVARFENPKDHRLLLSALRPLAGGPWTLDLVGDGPLRAAAEAYVRAHGLAHQVNFLGFRADVAQVLASAQLFVLVSRSESQPLTILEAMRAGLPVVASDVGGVSEMVEDGVTGTLAPADDRLRLTSAINAMVHDADLRLRFGAAGRQRFLREFDHERMVERITALYREIARRHRAPAASFDRASERPSSSSAVTG